MAETIPLIATAAEIRALAEKALEAYDALSDEPYEFDDPDSVRRHNLWLSAVFEALRFCSAAAAVAGDASVMPELVSALSLVGHYDDYPSGNAETLCIGVAALLQAGAPVTDDVREAAAHDEPVVRASIAGALRATDPAARKLLDTLAVDPAPEVRNAARAQLAKVGEVPWWLGKFASDPLPRLGADAAELAPMLADLSKLLDSPRYERKSHIEEILEHVARLPDELALEVLERLLGKAERYTQTDPEAVSALLARPGGDAALLRLLDAWLHERGGGGYYFESAALKACAELPSDHRLALCNELLRIVLASPESEQLEYHTYPWKLAGMVGKLWPTDTDPTPVIEAVLGLSPGANTRAGSHPVGSALAAALQESHVAVTDAALRDRLVEALLAGTPGLWSALAQGAQAALAQCDNAVLRPIVERAIVSGHDSVVEWGLELLVERLWDPARDGSKTDMILRFMREPQYRARFFDSAELAPYSLPWAREDLRAGRLGNTVALHTLQLIHRVWPSFADIDPLARRSLRRAGKTADATEEESEEDAEAKEERAAQHRALVEKVSLAAWPGAPEGPVTELEWDRYRAARDAQLSEKKHPGLWALTVQPVGPMHPADRAYLQAQVELVKEGDSKAAYFVCNAIAPKAEEIDLPLFDTLLEHCEPEDRVHIRLSRAEVRARLGLPDDTEEDEDATPSAEVPWMDQDDEDDGDEEEDDVE